MLKSISVAVQNVLSLEEPGIYGMAPSIAFFAFILTLGIFPPLLLAQCHLSMTVALGALSGMLISITSGPSECADRWKRAFLLAS